MKLLTQLNEKITALEQRPPQQIVVQPRPAMPMAPASHVVQEQAAPVEYEEPAPMATPIADRPRRVKVRRAKLWKTFD